MEWTKEEEWIIFLKRRDIERRLGEQNDSSSAEVEQSESDNSSDSLFDEVEDEDEEKSKDQKSTFGEVHWNEIALLIEYRTIDSIKYHWESVMQRKLSTMNFGLGSYLERTASLKHTSDWPVNKPSFDKLPVDKANEIKNKIEKQLLNLYIAEVKRT